MSLELVQTGKGSLTRGARKRLLSSVNPDMVLQLLSGDKLLWTMHASVFKGLLPMGAFVGVPDTLPAKSLATNCAQEWLVILVMIVGFEGVFPGKCHVAQRAGIRSNS